MAYKPVTAWKALKRVYRDPDDTRSVFVLLDALSGSYERDFIRFAKSGTGRKVLAEKRDLLETLRNREYLESLPEGSLGRSYVEFTAREEITPDGLVEASGGEWNPRFDGDEDRSRFYARYRDLHDLEHVVTGYGRDLRGEGALLAFDLAQSFSVGLALLVGIGVVDGDREQWRLVREAWSRGKRAARSLEQDWEALLLLPLDEVRERLRVGALPRYEELRSSGAPVAASPAAG